MREKIAMIRPLRRAAFQVFPSTLKPRKVDAFVLDNAGQNVRDDVHHGKNFILAFPP